MTTQPTVLPVTQAELTNTDISHSIKIGKQVLLSKLAEEIKKLDADMFIQYCGIAETMGGSFPMSMIMRPLFELVINNCSQLSKLRLAINTFEEKDMRKNMGLLVSNDLESVCKGITDPMYITGRHNNSEKSYRVNDKFKEVLKQGFLKVNYSFGVVWRDAGQWHEDGNQAEESSWNHNGYCEEILIPGETLDKMRALLPAVDALERRQVVLDSLREKLKNIDSTMEEMEATLLVNELGRTVRGKQVLAVTNDLIAGVLGDSFVALSAPKD